jgi:hypothetical protein
VGTSTTIFNMHRTTDGNGISNGITINYNPKSEKQIWLYDVTMQNGKMVNAGYDIGVAAITGNNTSLDDAIDKMFNAVGDFSFLDAYYRPRADYASTDYRTSIPNRLNYSLERKLYSLPFDVRIGDL